MKTIRLTLALLFIAFIITYCSKNDAKPSKTELLTGNSSKSWNITFSSLDNDESDESCKTVNSFSGDNAWIFKKNGDFEFSNGSIYEIPNCHACGCSDWVDLVGTWSLSAQDTLVITANGRIESDGQITALDEEELARFKVTSITATEMIIGVEPTGYVKFEPVK